LQVGDLVVSSGLDGIFPRGLPIGHIQAVDKQGQGLFQYAQIDPAVDVERLEEVLVMVGAPPAPPVGDDPEAPGPPPGRWRPVRRVFAIAAAGVLGMLLQTAVLPVFVPAGLVPNFLLVLVVYLAVHRFGAWGALGAFLLGYFLDTFSGTLLGLHAFAFTALYVAVHQIARVLWTAGGVPAMRIVFSAAFAHGLIALSGMSLVAAAGASVWQHALRQGLLAATAAAAVTPVVFAFVSWEQRLLVRG